MAKKEAEKKELANKKTKEKNLKKKENKKSSQPKESYLKKVKKELKLVKWPTAKEVLKYTASTIVLCLILCAFFLLLNLGLSFIKGLFV